MGQSGEILGDGLVGYRSGLGGVACVEWGAALDWVRKTKKGGSGFSAAKPTPTQPNPTQPNPTQRQTASKASAIQDAKEQQALAIINKGKLQEAEVIYRDLIKARSNNHIVYGNLGGLLKIKGDLQSAIASFNTALQLKPNFPDAHYNLGNALKKQGELKAAIASFNTALKLNPNLPEAHWNLSLTMLLGDDYKNG
ncbi:Photosystem I assembly protein Ycf3 [Prochlorococcus marinus str. MIT 1312]|nr:Photosystem I assembly protein Ycf3 [Prochlorococcus marinus str. MIT 1312]